MKYQFMIDNLKKIRKVNPTLIKCVNCKSDDIVPVHGDSWYCNHCNEHFVPRIKKR